MTQAHPKPAAYAPIIRLLHWSVALLVFSEFIIGWTMPSVQQTTVPSGSVRWHLSVGAAILALVQAQVVCRLIFERDPSSGSRSFRPMSSMAPLCLYVMMLAVPITGWADSSSRGWIVRLFGLLYYPLITGRNSSVGKALGAAHGWLAWILLSLAVAHIAWALFHRFVLRDDVLGRMI